VDAARLGRIAVPLAALAIAAVGVVVAFGTFGWDPTRPGGDPWNYLAAGERLQAGHPLYALPPGDRPVPLVPPYWSVPLLAPPSIAVLWSLVAPLGDAAMVAWGVTTIAAAVLVSVELPLGVLAILAVPIALTALSGNFSAIEMAGLAAVWRWRDRPVIAGILTAGLAAVKVTPVLLLVWLVGTRRWRALLVASAAGLAIVIVTSVVAGPVAWVDWLGGAASAAPSPLAPFRAVPPVLVFGLAAATAAVSSALLGQHRSFSIVVVAIALSSPAFYFQALAPLAAAFAPWRSQTVPRRRLQHPSEGGAAMHAVGPQESLTGSDSGGGSPL
jgi:hypothetical protein